MSIIRSIRSPFFALVLLAISSLAFRLRGYERLEERDGARAVLQEWHCELP